jgi:hypothetical protein
MTPILPGFEAARWQPAVCLEKQQFGRWYCERTASESGDLPNFALQ